MKKEGIPPTEITYNVCFGKISSHQEIKSEIEKLMASGFTFLKISYFYHLIRTADNYKLGRKLFNEMLSKDISPNVGIFN